MNKTVYYLRVIAPIKVFMFNALATKLIEKGKLTWNRLKREMKIQTKEQTLQPTIHFFLMLTRPTTPGHCHLCVIKKLSNGHAWQSIDSLNTGRIKRQKYTDNIVNKSRMNETNNIT